MMYTEDISKTNQGGIIQCRKKPKKVVQYVNVRTWHDT